MLIKKKNRKKPGKVVSHRGKAKGSGVFLRQTAVGCFVFCGDSKCAFVCEASSEQA